MMCLAANTAGSLLVIGCLAWPGAGHTAQVLQWPSFCFCLHLQVDAGPLEDTRV